MIRAAFRPVLLFVPLVAACAAPRDDGYPRLLPLDQLIAPPDLPAHAADAAASPDSVARDLRGRAAAIGARTAAPSSPVVDAGALERRAAALRRRAQALQVQDAPASEPPACAPDDPDCAQP